MKAKLWPNALGWDIGKDAEVWKLPNGLGVRVFTNDNRIKHLFIPDPSFDPIKAVERCKQEGTIEE